MDPLVPYLIQSLQSDPDRRVRSEAAETLGDFNDRADVQTVLRHAMNADTEEEVRREAAQALTRERQRSR